MFPIQYLGQIDFWVFTIFYIFSVYGAVQLILMVPRKSNTPPRFHLGLPKWVMPLFTLLLIEQFFHQAEHVTQMYQFKVIGLAASDAHGFVWFLDEEWNHFVFNTVYFFGLVAVFGMILQALNKNGITKSWANVGFIYAFLIWEGWHIVEHTYRIIHHVQGLCDQCAGILDPVTGIDRLVIHFWLNFVALTLPAAVYVWYGFPEMLRRYFRPQKA